MLKSSNSSLLRSTTDLRQLQYFVTVAEELHFGRAAERLHISQPPLSQSIQRLERDLGVQLLVRSRRHVSLTVAGQLLLKEARLALAQGENFKEVARQIVEGRMGTLRVGYTLSVPFLNSFTSAVRTFRAECPDVVLELVKVKTSSGVEAVAQCKLDVAVIRQFVSLPETLECIPITQDRFMMLLPSNHVLARKKIVSIDQIRDEIFIEYPREHQPALHDYIRQSWLNSHVKPRRIQEAADTLTIMALVAAGLGVSILPNTLRAIRLNDLAWREIAGSESHVGGQIVMVYRRSGSTDPVTRSFINLLRKAAPDEIGLPARPIGSN
jgi:DNA-binding transcriptional LysR family regulator